MLHGGMNRLLTLSLSSSYIHTYLQRIEALERQVKQGGGPTGGGGAQGGGGAGAVGGIPGLPR